MNKTTKIITLKTGLMVKQTTTDKTKIEVIGMSSNHYGSNTYENIQKSA